jgi:hypothetical protein
MQKLLNFSKNYAFVLNVNLYEKTKNSGKLAEFSYNWMSGEISSDNSKFWIN